MTPSNNQNRETYVEQAFAYAQAQVTNGAWKANYAFYWVEQAVEFFDNQAQSAQANS